mgnify:CR=1 FL=1
MKERNSDYTTRSKEGFQVVSDDSTIQGKISELVMLLNSNSTAVSLFNSITQGVSNRNYIIGHISTAIKLLKFHTSRDVKPSLSEFQQSLVKFIENLPYKSGPYRSQNVTIVKKIYKHLEADNFFTKDQLSKDFCIFDYCPVSRNEVTEELHKRLEIVSISRDITEATRQFISSKKVEKNYLRCFVQAFTEITNVDINWSPSAIKQGIENYRDSFDTNDGSQGTKYHEVSRVLELFSHLKHIGLINKKTVFPKNTKKPSSSSLMRSTNPTISEINPDSLSPEESLSSAKDLIQRFYHDLQTKLDCIVTVARNIILSQYKSYEANLNNIKFHGMPRELIVAMQIIMVDELGINPTPLYNLKVTIESAQRTKREFIKIEDDGSVRINVIKWRQRRLQKRTTETSNFPKSSELSINDINASFCIQLAILMTEAKRKQLKTNLLWITDIQTRLKKSNAFDREFRNFSDKYLPEDFSTLKPTLMRVRSSRAMEIYIGSDGDVVKTATYLGNKVKTTLSTYIPKYLQEVIYRRKISVFQHLYLVLATANEPEKEKMLGLTKEEYNKCLVEIYNNDDFGGPLFEKLQPKASQNKTNNESEIFFICSPENFAFAIKLLKTSKNKDSEIYKVCLNAINKASSGNILQKKMILEAEEILEREGFNYE